ncbi:MAG TPA: thiamine phosphate synthase [Kineosporiaceae bacterium]
MTDTRLCGALGVPATVAAAVSGGVTVVQLRDPTCPDRDFVALGRELARQLAGTGVPLLVNDRVHLVAAIGADGAHVGQGDLPVAAARQVLPAAGWLGLSVQTEEHVAAARSAGAGLVDYLGVGPVWPQTTKPDAAEPGGVRRVAAVVRASPWPCVAIGGIGPGRVAAVRAAGAAGIAVVSAVCGRPDPAAAARALRAEWDAAPPPPGDEPTGRSARRGAGRRHAGRHGGAG